MSDVDFGGVANRLLDEFYKLGGKIWFHYEGEDPSYNFTTPIGAPGARCRQILQHVRRGGDEFKGGFIDAWLDRNNCPPCPDESDGVAR